HAVRDQGARPRGRSRRRAHPGPARQRGGDRAMIALIVAATLAGSPGAIVAHAPDNDNGLHLHVEWENAAPDGANTVILRHQADAEVGAPPPIEGKVKSGDTVGGWTVAYYGDSDT